MPMKMPSHSWHPCAFFSEGRGIGTGRVIRNPAEARTPTGRCLTCDRGVRIGENLKNACLKPRKMDPLKFKIPQN